MRIDVYYDACCSRCGRHLSTDFDTGMSESSKTIKIWAKRVGWKFVNGENVCPKCLDKAEGDNE